jgi:hypothetical protein
MDSPLKANVEYDEKCIKILNDTIDFATYAYDINIIKGLYMVLGSVCVYTNKMLDSIKAFKMARNIASE